MSYDSLFEQLFIQDQQERERCNSSKMRTAVDTWDQFCICKTLCHWASDHRQQYSPETRRNFDARGCKPNPSNDTTSVTLDSLPAEVLINIAEHLCASNFEDFTVAELSAPSQAGLNSLSRLCVMSKRMDALARDLPTDCFDVVA